MGETGTARWVEARLRSGMEPEGRWVALSGWSMSPTLEPGDRLRVGPLGPNPLEPGELVLHRRGARLVVHRLVALDHARAVTRGDGNLHADPPVPRDALLGRVIEVRRRGRLHRLLARVGVRARAVLGPRLDGRSKSPGRGEGSR